MTTITRPISGNVKNTRRKSIRVRSGSINDDYYTFINHRWLSSVKLNRLQNYIIEIDEFRIAQDNAFNELIRYVTQYVKEHPNDSFSRNIENAHHSFASPDTIEQTRRKAREIEIQIEAEMGGTLWKRLATINKNEILQWGSPIVWEIAIDEKCHQDWICTISSPLLTFIDTDMYVDNIDDSTERVRFKESFRKKYREYLTDLFNVAFGESHGYDVRDVFECESQLNRFANIDVKQGNPWDASDINYTVVSTDKCKEFGFDWHTFCLNLGFAPDAIPHQFSTTQPKYIKEVIHHLVNVWNTPKWKTYWIFIYLRQQCRFNVEGWKSFYRFYGYFLRGQKSSVNPSIIPLFGLTYAFGNFLNEQFIHHNKTDVSRLKIECIETIIKSCKCQFKNLIQKTKWASPETKRQATRKIDNIHAYVAKSFIDFPDPPLTYSRHDLWENLEQIANWRCGEYIRQFHRHVPIYIPRISWNTIPPILDLNESYSVYAMYNQSTNSIHIPNAYLRPPFIDMNRNLEYNLANIGFTISHELAHSLDAAGKNFDQSNILNNYWWSESDKRQFYRIQEDIAAQYVVAAQRDGYNINPWNSMNENIADIVGVSICEQILCEHHSANKFTPSQSSKSFKNFYREYAVRCRQMINKDSIRAQLIYNLHPFNKYRCNIPLARSNIFRKIYDIKYGNWMRWQGGGIIWGN